MEHLCKALVLHCWIGLDCICRTVSRCAGHSSLLMSCWPVSVFGFSFGLTSTFLPAPFPYLYRYTWTSDKPHVIQELQTSRSQQTLEKDTGNLDVCILLSPREVTLCCSACSDCHLVVRFGTFKLWIISFYNSVIIHSKMTQCLPPSLPPGIITAGSLGAEIVRGMGGGKKQVSTLSLPLRGVSYLLPPKVKILLGFSCF